MKSIDLFIGLKAEQSLRDTVRQHSEQDGQRDDVLELCPVGKKDWIAGERQGSTLELSKVDGASRQVMKNLVKLGSLQRIRTDGMRVYAVREPVPVFKDPAPEDLLQEAMGATEQKGDTIICPVCQAQVQRYNAQHDPSGKVVGCYLCRGEPRNRR